MTTATEPAPVQQQPPYTNVHGRKPGRGIRPWLIAAKVIAVALYVGGLASVTFIWLTSDYNALPPDDPRRQWLLNLVGRMMVYFVVPALLVAMLLGVLLLLQHPRVFLRMRWLQVKLILLLILIPAGHFWCRARVRELRNLHAPPKVHHLAARGLSWGLVGTLVGSVVVVVIGRTKPRLAQGPR
jgi:uncharacterized membrane protein